MDYEEIINQMSLEEKAQLCVGEDYWNSKEFEKYGIPKIKMSDGPHGLRVQKEKQDNLGINESEVSVCFPTSSTLANSWNREMAYELGRALGQEAKTEGVNIVLGPAINIKRTPLCGRNFEYFSEDPYLTGILGSEYVKGLQEQNVGACVKHFAVNNQENRRRTIDVVIDERNLREIYLKAFEMIIEKSKPWSIMSAYNKVNGEYCSENTHLLEEILRKEWNYKGIVISDWGAENNRVKGIENDHELEMPGGRGNGVEEIIEAVKTGRISERKLNNIVDRIINIAIRGEKDNNSEKYDKEKHHRIAEKIAEESIVLLKNEEHILPIYNKKIALIGDMAKYPRYQGAGSSTINPYKIENAYDNLKENNLIFDYAKGYERIESENDKGLIKEAINVAKKNEIVVLFIGLTENFESEGVDRENLNIPENQIKLIEEIYKVNKNIVVVLSNGAPIVMPWKDKVKAIITGYLGGEAGARAMINCILGKVNPSGKLAETYPVRIEDTPCYNNYPGTELTVEYQESIYVGYRFYDTNNLNVLFPFGYGLSYTEFEYSNLKVNKKDNEIEILFKIKNIGNMKGKEIAQIYISQENSCIFKPKKELKEFEKIELDVEEEKEIKIVLSKKAFEYYNPETFSWSVEQGKYKILIGKSSKDIVLEKEIFIESKDKNIEKQYPKKYYTGNINEITDSEFEELLGRKIPNRNLILAQINEENTLEQIKETKIGKYIYENQMKKMKKLLKEQNVNKATKIMMDLQKPLKKFYEKKSSKITKEMVDELIEIAKNDYDFNDNICVNEYLKY